MHLLLNQTKRSCTQLCKCFMHRAGMSKHRTKETIVQQSLWQAKVLYLVCTYVDEERRCPFTQSHFA